MSDIGTATSQVGTVNGQTTIAKLKHIGVSLMPLALFLAWALGTEQLTQRRPASAANSLAPAMTSKPVAGPSGSSDTVKATRTQLASALPPQQPVAIGRQPAIPDTKWATQARLAPGVENSLRDERSLLELSRFEAARAPHPVPAEVSPPAVVAASAEVPTPVAPLAEPAVTHRALETTIDRVEAMPLGFKSAAYTEAVGYAIVRGMPQPAVLSHGIAIGDDSWLIDGIDLALAAIDLRAQAPGKVVLELAVLSATSTLLQREIVTIEVKPSARAEPAERTPLVPVANATAQTDTSFEFAAQPAAAPPVGVRISSETHLVPGRGSLLKLDIAPASAVPHGAVVVMRGLPAGTVMSRGIQMGPDAWLLTPSELAGLEARLPAKVTAAVRLVVNLVTSDGNLIVEQRHEIPVRAPAAAAASKLQPVAVAPTAPAPSVPAPTAAVRPVRNTTPAPPAQVATPAQVALTRGRRMLELGNIAAARPLLERSAREGSGEAAALLAASFDADWLREKGALGIAADATKASYWTEEARKLGTNGRDR